MAASEIFILIFTRIRIAFFNSYKMVQSENSPESNKTLQISTGAIAKNQEILNFVPDHIRT